MAFKWATKTGKPYKYGSVRYAPAKLHKAINRYASGMTVGHGSYKMWVGTDPIGAQCRGVYGAFADGRLVIEMPGGGCTVLGKADVEITDYSNLTDEEQSFISGLPIISLVKDDEIVDMQGNIVGGKPTRPKP